MKGIIVNVERQEIKEIEDGMSFPELTLDELKNQKLIELKHYVSSLLSLTDYVIIKIAEAQAIGDTSQVDSLKQKYSTQLQQREAIRAWNEQMKQSINNAQSLDDLLSLEIKFKEPTNA
jgi:hypothetical protein